MIRKPGVPYNVARGGSAYRSQAGKTAETSTFRYVIPSTIRDNKVGFRLVRDN
jgi:hypothetical protein